MAAQTPPPLKLFVFIQGLGNSSFSVSIAKSETVDDLKEAILKKSFDVLKDISAQRLTLYKVALPDGEELEHLASQADAQKDKLKVPSDELSSVFPTDPPKRTVSILVEVPGFGPKLDHKEEKWQRIEGKIKHLVFVAPAKNDFGSGDNVEENKIYNRDWDDPAFAKVRELVSQVHLWAKEPSCEAQTLCKQLKGLGADIKEWFRSSDQSARGLETAEVLEHLAGTLAEAQETDAPSTDGEKMWLEDHQYAHLSWITRSWDWTTCTKLYEEDVHSDFAQLVGYTGKGSPYRHGFGRTEWPCYLVARVEKEMYKYAPKSDFHISIYRLPVFLVEVESGGNDRVRLLIQAGCVARMAHENRTNANEPFFVIGLYLGNDRKSDRYIFCVDPKDKTQVIYATHRFDLSEPLDRFKFLFELYSLLRRIRKDHNLKSEVEEKIKTMIKTVRELDLVGFTTTKRKHGGGPGRASKRQAGTDDQGHPSRVQEQDVLDDPGVVEEFEAAGIVFEEEVPGWTPLQKLPCHIKKATDCEGKAVAVKLLRSCSHEQLILRYLSEVNAGSPHTVPLLATLTIRAAVYLVFPWAQPLDGVLLYHTTASATIPKLKQQFLRAVGFLHRNGVAHRDLKPSNAVVSPEGNLWIIDFGLAVRVTGPNDVIVEWCGTPEWMAPEIGKRDDPERPYSPIRADLWACGKILLYFGKFTSDTEYMDQVQLLLDKEPQRRPLLDMICPEEERRVPLRPKSTKSPKVKPMKGSLHSSKILPHQVLVGLR